MTMATCNRHCAGGKNGTCELAGLLDPGLPALCPYYQHQLTPGPLEGGVAGLARLPGNLVTSAHQRYPGSQFLPGSTSAGA
ncbi:MAG: hypothetical protein PWQ18_61 [Clostridia bacterium]|nr:hypothetical protein [Clostridia bacterium]